MLLSEPAVGEEAGSAGGMLCRLSTDCESGIHRFRDAASETGAGGRDVTQKLIGPRMVPLMGLVRPCCWHRTRLSWVGLIRSLSAFGCDSSQSCRNVARGRYRCPFSQPRSELHAGSP